MLDIHVLTLDSTPRDWVERRRATIAAAIAAAGFPVTVREIPGYVGHIGKGRVTGFALGDAPYVSYVDDDDYLEPNAFACLAPAMAQDADAIFTGEQVLHGGKITRRNERHNLTVVRRSIAASADMDLFRMLPEVRLRVLATGPGRKVVDVPDHVYVYRSYLSAAKQLLHGDRAASSAELERANG